MAYDLVSSSASPGTTLLFMGRFVIWSVGSLTASGPNSGATLTIRAIVRAAGDHANTATIGSASVSDPDASNDSATLTVTPLP